MYNESGMITLIESILSAAWYHINNLITDPYWTDDKSLDVIQYTVPTHETSRPLHSKELMQYITVFKIFQNIKHLNIWFVDKVHTHVACFKSVKYEREIANQADKISLWFYFMVCGTCLPRATVDFFHLHLLWSFLTAVAVSKKFNNTFL